MPIILLGDDNSYLSMTGCSGKANVNTHKRQQIIPKTDEIFEAFNNLELVTI